MKAARVGYYDEAEKDILKPLSRLKSWVFGLVDGKDANAIYLPARLITWMKQFAACSVFALKLPSRADRFRGRAEPPRPSFWRAPV